MWCVRRLAPRGSRMSRTRAPPLPRACPWSACFRVPVIPVATPGGCLARRTNGRLGAAWPAPSGASFVLPGCSSPPSATWVCSPPCGPCRLLMRRPARTRIRVPVISASSRVTPFHRPRCSSRRVSPRSASLSRPHGPSCVSPRSGGHSVDLLPSSPIGAAALCRALPGGRRVRSAPRAHTSRAATRLEAPSDRMLFHRGSSETGRAARAIWGSAARLVRRSLSRRRWFCSAPAGSVGGGWWAGGGSLTVLDGSCGGGLCSVQWFVVRGVRGCRRS